MPSLALQKKISSLCNHNNTDHCNAPRLCSQAIESIAMVKITQPRPEDKSMDRVQIDVSEILGLFMAEAAKIEGAGRDGVARFRPLLERLALGL